LEDIAMDKSKLPEDKSGKVIMKPKPQPGQVDYNAKKGVKKAVKKKKSMLDEAGKY